MLLVAIGCGRLPEILGIIKRHSFVVFGTMDEGPLSQFADRNKEIIDSPVYFYETG